MDKNRLQPAAAMIVASFVIAIALGTRPATPSKGSPTKNATPIELEVDPELARMGLSYGSPDAPILPLTEAVRVQAKRLAATVRAMYREGKVRTGGEYLAAASVLARTGDRTDLLLANEMAMAALAKGDARASNLLMWTHDRLLVTSGSKQRFGTQYHEDSGKFMLLPLDPDVTDRHRIALGGGTAADARRMAKTLTARGGRKSPAEGPRMARMPLSAF